MYVCVGVLMFVCRCVDVFVCVCVSGWVEVGGGVVRGLMCIDV